MTHPPPFEPGHVVGGRYSIEAPLAEGAIGIVWEASNVVTGERVALKTLRPRFLGQPHVVARFGREVIALRALQHPNIVAYYDHGQDAGRPFMVTELVKGYRATEFIRRDPPLRPTEIMRVLKQLCSALTLAHRHGIIHRDLKWENVMVTSRRYGSLPIKLIDFGILKFSDDSALRDGRRLTKSGVIVGTPEYASPEQLLGRPLDARSDVYALGVMIYELMTWTKPFRGGTHLQTIMKQLNERAAPPETLGGPYPVTPALSSALLRALEKRPNDRHPTVNAFYKALGRALGVNVSSPK